MSDDLDIPDFLRLTAEERAQGWRDNPPKAWPKASTASTFAQLDEQRKQEGRERIAKMKAKRPGKKWDAKRKEWIDA